MCCRCEALEVTGIDAEWPMKRQKGLTAEYAEYAENRILPACFREGKSGSAKAYYLLGVDCLHDPNI